MAGNARFGLLTDFGTRFTGTLATKLGIPGRPPPPSDRGIVRGALKGRSILGNSGREITGPLRGIGRVGLGNGRRGGQNGPFPLGIRGANGFWIFTRPSSGSGRLGT